MLSNSVSAVGVLARAEGFISCAVHCQVHASVVTAEEALGEGSRQEGIRAVLTDIYGYLRPVYDGAVLLFAELSDIL